MFEVHEASISTRRFVRSLALSLLGGVLLSPVPLLAAAPALTPAWLMGVIGGVPVLSLALVLLMVVLVGVSLLCLSNPEKYGD